MKQNMSPGDRVSRGILGVATLLIALFFVTGAWQVVLYVLAGILLLTAVAGVCPLYLLFHLSTRKA